jgi:selenocysteine lyase/cysteine desulfurase
LGAAGGRRHAVLGPRRTLADVEPLVLHERPVRILSARPSVDEVRALWEPAGPYLDTASYGLPPRPAWDALQAALADWRSGRTSWEPWCEATERSRELFARLVGVRAERVATGSGVSGLVALVAAAAPDGTRVVAPDVEFSSLLYPWLVHADRGVSVRTVPLPALADAIDGTTDVVAVSAVQSKDGALADLDAVLAAAAEHDALTVVDATHACGWLPLDASRFDAVVCAAYKWLLSPRGTAFMVLGDRLLERVKPQAANWYSTGDPLAGYYGPPLRLAATARRFDFSPAWFAWVGTAPALEVLLDVGVEQIHAHDVALADRFRAGLGLAPAPSAIVSADVEGAHEKLARAGIRAATRAGTLRAAFHLYNTEEDVDAALAALVA